MKCPVCSFPETKVIDSRKTEDQNSIRRRRQCEACGKRFTTFEIMERSPLSVVKKDGTREPYSREKVLSGVMRACHKRAVSRDQIDNLVDSVENTLYSELAKEVDSTFIGGLVMDKLKDLDEVAYVRFASIYREFKDISSFVNEINVLKTEQDKSENKE
ncbi:transcriptional repressor NrdR [Clostridiales bacterium COT073_COT-073]|nr:transcriptional repressor NrdR [Clostridiales bacterium COT073_COT-073]